MISVCMATYNGESYIEEQLNSILEQLGEFDEVVICDDCSSDNTINVINSIGDSRVKVFSNEENLGYIRNFIKSITLAKGEVIFLADQDDIWIKGRLALMLKELEVSGKMVVVGNYDCFNQLDSEIFKPNISLSSKSNGSYLKNILTMFKGGIPYFGCCMAFTKDFKEIFLNKCSYEISHDIMIALIGNRFGCIHHIERPVLLRRVHSLNVTNSNRPLRDKLMTRLKWLSFILRV